MRTTKCYRCQGDICFTWDKWKAQWWPTEIESLTSEDTPFESTVYRSSWHQTHRCNGVKKAAPKTNPAFAVLHLLPTAPQQVIRAAYRALADLNHPDKGGDTRKMQAINAAYEALK